LNGEYEKRGASIVGVSFDTVEENAAFAKKYQFPYPLICDTSREIGIKYHACDKPDDGFARRITYVVGPDGRITHAVENVNATEHPGLLLAGLI
jgi:thioredoxin-dependent peroxiredoxin